MGEIIGAEIYIAERVGRPASYPAVASLGVAALVTTFDLNWRLAFWVGASVALVGAVARTRLRETPEFIKMEKERLKHLIEQVNRDENRKTETEPQSMPGATWKEPIALKTLVAYFLIFCGNPLSFYLTFIYFNQTLKSQFGYAPETVITHNFFLTLIMLGASIFWTF